MSYKGREDVLSHPRYLITMKASAVQATLTALHDTFPKENFVGETFPADETISAEDKKSQILHGVFFDEHITDAHMTEIDLAIKQLQELDHEIGYSSDKLKQLIIEGFPDDDEARNRHQIELYLEKEEFKIAFVNAIKVLRKPDSAVVLVTTSDLDCLLKSHHVMDGKPFTIRECRNPPGLKEFGPNFRLQLKPSDKDKFKTDTLSGASQGRSLSPDAGSNSFRGEQYQPLDQPMKDCEILGGDSQGSKESRQPTHGGSGDKEIFKVQPRNRSRAQQAQGNVSSMPQSSLRPSQTSPSVHQTSSYSVGEAAHFTAGHSWSNQTIETRISIGSSEKLSLIFWMCISKKLGVEGDAVQFVPDIKSVSLIMRGPTSAVHNAVSYVEQSLLRLDTVRTQVDIRSDLARKLAEKVEPPYDSWVADFMEAKGYPAVTITARASVVRNEMVLEVVAFVQDEANRMADVLKKYLLCANVPCDKCDKSAIEPRPSKWNEWEKGRLLVINPVDNYSKVEVYGISKDVIKVVNLMYEWVYTKSKKY